MVKRFPAMDAWMREAAEAARLIDDLEIRIKNRSPDLPHGLKDSAKPKLLELGVKLDRLESLLHNPPSKPILYVSRTLKIVHLIQINGHLADRLSLPRVVSRAQGSIRILLDDIFLHLLIDCVLRLGGSFLELEPICFLFQKRLPTYVSCPLGLPSSFRASPNNQDTMLEICG